jgi:hypothetical protein
MPMREVVDFVREFDAYFLLGLTAVSLLLIIYTICLSRKLGAVTRRQRARLAGGEVGEIVNSIVEHSETLAGLHELVNELNAKHVEHRDLISNCYQKIGIVRFNAYDDVGGEQSFALVLMDTNSNGIAISSLYGRQDSRLYVKGIVNGHGERALSEEEQRALDQALAGRGLAGVGR